MGGILDSKQRILDCILTKEGKKQLARGTFQAKFYSFTDTGALYTEDTIVSGGLDATYRISLEASSKPQDQIVFEADEGGKLKAFAVSGSEEYSIIQGQIFSGSREGARIQVTGSQFINVAGTLLSQSIDAFKNQLILKSPDPLDDKERQFLIGPEQVDFAITNKKPFGQNEISEAKLNHIESLFQDKRLSHIPNFKFLPPINEAPGVVTGEKILLGNYVNIKQQGIKNFEELQRKLEPLERMGYSQEINFIETSEGSNLLCQFFEVSDGSMKKLDVIDFGSFPSPNGGPSKHVFFVGKLIMDDSNTYVFINIFNLVFET